MIHEAFPDKFDLDVNVSVFESNIRLLGGLLSGHILASDPTLGLFAPPPSSSSAASWSSKKKKKKKEKEMTQLSKSDSDATGYAAAAEDAGPHAAFDSNEGEETEAEEEAEEEAEAVITPYDGSLLELAIDLGERLMPAFDTPTHIPYGTVNLRFGVPKGETVISSLAGAVSQSTNCNQAGSPSAHLRKNEGSPLSLPSCLRIFVSLSVGWLNDTNKQTNLRMIQKGSLAMEFSMLSELTGEPKYGEAAQNAAVSPARRARKRLAYNSHFGLITSIE